MMTTVLFVIIEKDVGIIRHIVRLVILVNILKILSFSLIAWALKSPEILNPFNTSALLFSDSVYLLVLGGILIVVELIFLVFVFEKIKEKNKNLLTVSLLYILVFVLVLCLDGVLFPVIAFAFNPNLIGIVVGGLPGKLIMAMAYSIPMFIFLITYKRTVNDYLNQPLILTEIIFARREELIEKIQLQTKSLTLSEEKFRHLAESIDDTFFSVDSDMRYTFWNKASENTGFREHEVIGKRMYDLFPEIKNTDLDKFYLSVLQTGVAGQHIEHTRSQGHDQYYAISAYPFGSGLSVIARDISEFKDLESRLLQIQKMDSIGQLAGGIAHDFNNILVPITAYAELGMIATEREDKRYGYFEGTYKAAAQATSLTSQILAFSRKQVLKVTVLDLNHELLEFESMIQRLIGENIECTIAVEPDLGRIKADRGQIKQVLLNLVVNARDALPKGGSLTIASKNVFLDETSGVEYDDVAPTGHYVLLQVKDNGIGMDSKTQSKIFEPFFTTKNQSKKTGLGLATVFGIIKQHSGYVSVTSSPELGSTFDIYLPRTEEPMDEIDNNIKETELAKANGTVLVVEDDELVRSVVCEMLGMHGYTVIEARTPLEALELAASTDAIDLILSDVIMPEMNGLELYQRLITQEPTLKVVFMSGYTDDVIADQGILDVGVNFIQKPFVLKDLLGKVKYALDH